MRANDSLGPRLQGLLAISRAARWTSLNLAGLVALLPLALHAADQIPGKPATGPIAIVGATLHTVQGDDIERGTLVFENGRITQVGRDAAPPDGAEIIRADGKHVYPSLISASSDIGLVEINSVRGSIDVQEVGSMNPNVRAAVAFNPDSELIPVSRANGILLAVTAPTGSLVAGRSALMMLDGWTREDMTLKADTGHVRWPGNVSGVRQLEEIVEQARRYAATRDSGASPSQPLDLRLEAMRSVLENSVPWIVEANSVDEIRAAVAFATRHDLRLIIEGGVNAPSCAELLIDHAIPVIVAGVYHNPSQRDNAYDEAYSLPARLQQAGITFCITASNRFGASGLRNLPYHAATAAAYGLPEREALRAITLTPAEILGVADRVGSLSVDRDATLFIADGDILETPTQVETAFIQGRRVDLTSRHTQLYEKYSRKPSLAEPRSDDR